jgi:hypothetical protein
MPLHADPSTAKRHGINAAQCQKRKEEAQASTGRPGLDRARQTTLAPLGGRPSSAQLTAVWVRKFDLDLAPPANCKAYTQARNTSNPCR